MIRLSTRVKKYCQQVSGDIGTRGWMTLKTDLKTNRMWRCKLNSRDSK